MAQIYVPIAQDVWRESYLLVRTTGPADAHVGADSCRDRRVDPHLPVRAVQTLETVAREATARYRFRAVLVVMFAGLALVLALGGLFGVLAYVVQQRQREFGLRLALGATPADVLQLVMREAGVVVAAGIAIGLAGGGRGWAVVVGVLVRRAAARPMDVRRRGRRDGAHGRGGGRRARVAGDARRSGHSVPGRVINAPLDVRKEHC